MGFATDENNKPKSLVEIFDWQLDKTVSPPRMVFGVAGKTGSGDYVAVSVDGTGAVAVGSSNYATKVTEVGTTTYVGFAAVGTAEATSIWQARKVTITGSDTTVTWADGDDSFDNVATDLTALSYS